MYFLLHLFVALIFHFHLCPGEASAKFNQRTFVDSIVINYVDPTKHGFRIILRDEFLREHMAPTLLPTLYITAIPLAKNGQATVTKVLYPDTVNEDKHIIINELKESSWYYLCVEWENFNRYNETMGTDCRIFKTLDKLGKGSDTSVIAIEATDVSSQIFQFLVKVTVDFAMRITISLQHGRGVPAPAAQVFHVTTTSELEVIFPYLRKQKDYGKLCILEEPLVNGYTAMGRIVNGLSTQKCHFNNLTTKDYELSIVEQPEASPYKRNIAVRSMRTLLVWPILLACHFLPQVTRRLSRVIERPSLL